MQEISRVRMQTSHCVKVQKGIGKRYLVRRTQASEKFKGGVGEDRSARREGGQLRQPGKKQRR